MSLDVLPLDVVRLDLQAAGARGELRVQERGEGPDHQRQPGGHSASVHAWISGPRWPAVKRRGRGRSWLLAGCLLLAGCSGATVVYEQLDVLLPWYFRDYVDLDTGQRRQLEQAVDGLLAWHRESEIGRYAAFLRELERDAAAPLGLDRIRAARFELDAFWDDVARRLAPEAAALLSTLSDEQVEDLFARMDRDDAKQAREARGRSPEERVSRREKALHRQLERWVGRLDDRQEGLVAACAAELRADPEGWIASRQAWAAALREALAERRDPARLRPRLERLLSDGESFWDPGYRRQFDVDRERVIRLFAEIDASLTAKQRSALRIRLERWALDLEAIAGGA
jgi:hypothetical protein